MTDIRYLVFSGGGAAGYAFAGALSALGKEPNFSYERIKAVAGTSVGTLAALMVALKYTPEEAKEKLSALDLKKLQDGGPFVAQAFRLLSRYGIYKGQALYAFILQLLQEKTGRADPENITFEELKKMGYKDLYVVATKLFKEDNTPTGKQKVFSFEKTPQTSVAAAILASSAAPIYFARIRFKKIAKGTYVFDESGHVFNDGGILNNFPITIFDEPRFMDLPHQPGKKIINPHTLGLALRKTDKIKNPESKPQKNVIKDWHPIEYTESIINSLLTQVEDENLDKTFNLKRTVQIDRLNVKINDFEMDEIKKQALIESGEKAVKAYFDNMQPQPSPMVRLSLWQPVNTSEFERNLQPVSNGESYSPKSQ